MQKGGEATPSSNPNAANLLVTHRNKITIKTHPPPTLVKNPNTVALTHFRARARPRRTCLHMCVCV